MSQIILTDHAIQRAKERLSWPPHTIEKMALKAFNEDKDFTSAKGHLKKYIAKQFYKGQHQANKIKIHGEIVYLFSNNILITIFLLPNDLKKLARR